MTIANDPTRLKPCPFCGDIAETLPHQWPDGFSVRCVNELCYVRPRTQECNTETEAAEAWNRRKP